MDIRKVLSDYLVLNKLLNSEFLKRYSYEISKLGYYREQSASDPSQRVYCEEILQRAHLAAVSSALRNLKWINGVISSIEETNLLSFTANLRGLIESCCDTFDSLGSIPIALATHYDRFKTALEGQAEKSSVIFEDLENCLIHFAYARKIKKVDREQIDYIPKSHNAKAVKDCLKKLDNGREDGPLTNLYSLLCQFCHPAAHSIHYLYKVEEEEKYFKFSYLSDPDESNINDFLNHYSGEIVATINIGLNSCLVILKTLNSFNYTVTKTPFIDSIPLEDIESWKKVKSILQEKAAL